MIKVSENSQEATAKALKQNRLIHDYVLAADHALLWIAALSIAAYFHLAPEYSRPEALLFSTLVAYGAYICESALGTLKTAAAASSYRLDFKKAGMWHWIALNIAINTLLTVTFLNNPSWIIFILIILTAGWQKYMDGRIPPRLMATRQINDPQHDNHKNI